MSAYDQAFYDSQMTESLASARIYLAHLWKLYQPSSVVDVGCGRGMWLKAAGELGATRLLGLDGPWNRQDLMVDPAIEFQAVDLNKRFAVDKCDLALSLEVAEHLEESSARDFVASITSAADVVVFGAAYTGQGGTNHINEQPASYWAKLFAEEGLRAHDVFRPALWSDGRIPFWYRQNTFLYSRQVFEGYEVPLGFMDCVHPDMYGIARLQASYQPSLKEHLVQAVRRRLPFRPPA
jgi:SAM-dependent methyltransferase